MNKAITITFDKTIAAKDTQEVDARLRGDLQDIRDDFENRATVTQGINSVFFTRRYLDGNMSTVATISGSYTFEAITEEGPSLKELLLRRFENRFHAGEFFLPA